MVDAPEALLLGETAPQDLDARSASTRNHRGTESGFGEGAQTISVPSTPAPAQPVSVCKNGLGEGSSRLPLPGSSGAQDELGVTQWWQIFFDRPKALRDKSLYVCHYPKAGQRCRGESTEASAGARNVPWALGAPQHLDDPSAGNAWRRIDDDRDRLSRLKPEVLSGRPSQRLAPNQAPAVALAEPFGQHQIQRAGRQLLVQDAAEFDREETTRSSDAPKRRRPRTGLFVKYLAARSLVSRMLRAKPNMTSPSAVSSTERVSRR